LRVSPGVLLATPALLSFVLVHCLQNLDYKNRADVTFMRRTLVFTFFFAALTAGEELDLRLADGTF